MCLRKHWTSVALCFCAVLTVGICLGDEPAAPTVAASWVDSSDRAPGTRQTFEIDGDEYGLRWIPAGEFEMGDPQDPNGRKNDRPQRHVTLTSGFWLLETAVTQKLYRQIMGDNPSFQQGDDRPVECVSWDQATEFCQKLSERLPEGLVAELPTEAQWEYACRAGTSTAYNWGDEWDEDKANITRARIDVKQYPPNQWGLYDMHGNICEWCRDGYGPYPEGPLVDPQGPQEFEQRVVRGGSWNCGGPRPLGRADAALQYQL
ncbi:MAG: formylglycine-generating enzyme family protein [Thermoguttaceae bacterium]|jgi:sulfatase modifying factor 1